MSSVNVAPGRCASLQLECGGTHPVPSGIPLPRKRRLASGADEVHGSALPDWAAWSSAKYRLPRCPWTECVYSASVNLYVASVVNPSEEQGHSTRFLNYHTSGASDPLIPLFQCSNAKHTSDRPGPFKIPYPDFELLSLWATASDGSHRAAPKRVMWQEREQALDKQKVQSSRRRALKESMGRGTAACGARDVPICR